MKTDRPTVAVGLMSGTSLDGMDAALVEIDSKGALKLLAFHERPYLASERAVIESVLAGGPISDVARLHAALGDWAIEAIDSLLDSADQDAEELSFIAFPGQTVWHEPPVVTFQIGDGARVAERFGADVVHDFRSRDLAAGGEGAPLVPIVDELCFRSTDQPRLLLNIGGMANVTWVPPVDSPESAIAADTGPGMAVIDAVARMVDGTRPFDVGGELAGLGAVNNTLLSELMRDPFFHRPPPRSTGREHFGEEFARRLFRTEPGVDAVRTAVELTALTIVNFCREFLPPAEELVVSGGGSRHPVLMRRLDEELAIGGVVMKRFEELYFPSEAKEAAAFAVLGWLSLKGRAGNLPLVTGARGSRVLGSVIPGVSEAG